MSDRRSIYDIHHHLGQSPLDDSSEEMTTDEKADRHIDKMKSSGIAGAAIMPPPNYKNPRGLADTREINDEIAELSKKSEWFPVGIGTVEPSYGMEGLSEIDRVFTELDLDGLMWHNRWQKATPDAPIMYEFLEAASEHEPIVHLHVYVESKITTPWRVFNIIEDFEDITFVVHDIFSGYDQHVYCLQEAPRLDNAYFDTAAAPFLDRRVDEFVEEVGADKLVFGTDYYTNFPIRSSWEVQAIQSTGIEKSSLDKIFWKNFKEIYGLDDI